MPIERVYRCWQWIALPIVAGGLSGCVGMSAPYERKTIQPEEIELIPVTGELLLKMAEDNGANAMPAPPPPPGTEEYRYLIGPGDVLQISVPSIVSFNSGSNVTVFGDSGQTYNVFDDGTIYLPYSGAVKVGGLSLKEVQDAVVKGLSGYLRSPQVLVTVKEFRSQRVMVTGQVEKPGYIPVTDVPMTLIGALSTVGGITERRGSTDPRVVGSSLQGSGQGAEEYPDLRNVVLRRNNQRYRIDVTALLASGNAGQDPVLQDGDVVVVPSALRANAFVLGEVARPGLLEIDRNDTDLADLVMYAGGINQLSANPSRVYVIRGDYRKPTVYQVDASRPDAFLLAQKFRIRPNDVVYVSEAGATRWNRSLSQIMPTIQSLLSTAIVANTVDDLQN